MTFEDYQNTAAQTIQKYSPNRNDDNVIAFLGIIGEAGSVISELKKKIRDGDNYTGYAEKLKEELGDVLWYIAAIATQHEMKLEEIAAQNIKKVNDRFTETDETSFKNYDLDYPDAEKFPNEFEIKFISFDEDGKKKLKILDENGNVIGNILTDNSHQEDGYRFHDVFHYGYVAHLGWSPVIRALLKKKRKSKNEIDENEDGARAIIIEELISLYVYNDAANHQFYKYSNSLGTDVLKTIQNLTSTIEVGDCTAKQWENAILNSYKVFNELAVNDGGRVLVSLKNRKLLYIGKN